MQKQLDEFYILHDREHFDGAEEKVNELSEIMGENDSEIVRAKTMLNLKDHDV